MMCYGSNAYGARSAWGDRRAQRNLPPDGLGGVGVGLSVAQAMFKRKYRWRI